MRRMLLADRLAYGAKIFKIPSTEERGAMFLRIIAIKTKKGSTNECRTWLLGEHVGFLICAEKVAYCLHRNLLAAETRHLNRSALVTPRLHSAKTRWGDTKVNVSHGGSYLQRRRKGHMMRMPLNSPTLAAPHLKHFSLFRKLYRPHCDKPRTML